MISVIVVEKMVAAAVLLCSVSVGLIIIRHGDWPLGLMLLFAQLQSLLGHSEYSASNEAANLAVHNEI
jgi:hypothetical protein